MLHVIQSDMEKKFFYSILFLSRTRHGLSHQAIHGRRIDQIFHSKHHVRQPHSYICHQRAHVSGGIVPVVMWRFCLLSRHHELHHEDGMYCMYVCLCLKTGTGKLIKI